MQNIDILPEDLQIPQDYVRLPFRKRCNRKCCGFALWTKYVDAKLNQEQQLLVPLKDVRILGVLEAGHATIDVQLTYSNVSDSNPIECTFEFPLDKQTVVGKLIAQVDDKIIEATIKEKEEAKQTYNDAIASGSTAVYAERDSTKKEESITLLLGNLLPGQTARIDIQLIRPLTIEGGAFEFVLPTAFMPQYKQHEIAQNFHLADDWYLNENKKDLQEILPEYTFSYCFEIKSKDKITFIGASDDAVKTQTDGGYKIFIDASNKIPKREIKIYYKTRDMLKPSLKYQVDEKSGEVACLASFVPTFEPFQPQQDTVISSESPEETEMGSGKDYCFIFVVDRSGSMDGIRMSLTIQALQLFVKSLPVGSTFAILGFGSQPQFECTNGRTSKFPTPEAIWDYNDDTQKQILTKISTFSADLGGTEILNPLKLIVNLDTMGRKKRVFLLTDGEVSNKPQVIDFAGLNSEKIRIHSFGIGSGCDRELIEKTAIAGRGSFSFADDNSTDLSGQVITALKKASQLSLGNCEFTFCGKEVKLGEVFRNQLVQSYQIMTQAEFENAKVTFTSTIDHFTNLPIKLEFTRADFEASDMPLFKIAAHEHQSSAGFQNSLAQKVAYSIKYQVLSQETAMVGVVKQKKKATGEVIEYTIQMGKVASAPPLTVQKLPNRSASSSYSSFMPMSCSVSSPDGFSAFSPPASSNYGPPIQSAMPPAFCYGGPPIAPQSMQPTSKMYSIKPGKHGSAKQVVVPYKQDQTDKGANDSKEQLRFLAQLQQDEEIKQYIMQYGSECCVASADANLELMSYEKKEDNWGLFDDEQEQEEKESQDTLSELMETSMPAPNAPIPKNTPQESNLVKPATSRPTFTELISFQSSEGFWLSSSLACLQTFFKQQLPTHLKVEVQCTLAALFVLEEFFSDRENEWTLIQKKAKEYLKRQGVAVNQEMDLLSSLV